MYIYIYIRKHEGESERVATKARQNGLRFMQKKKEGELRLFDKLKIEKGEERKQIRGMVYGDGNSESLIRLEGIEASVFGRNGGSSLSVYFPNSSRIMVSRDEYGAGGIIFSDHLPRPPVITRCFNLRKVVSTFVRLLYPVYPARHHPTYSLTSLSSP